ncbi:MAG: hypothetical protein GF332_00380 [Candidatus Moranbacteria bacterium]|nr:hypothetical protein [Candidatus Moranbacteria bacterium]
MASKLSRRTKIYLTVAGLAGIILFLVFLNSLLGQNPEKIHPVPDQQLKIGLTTDIQCYGKYDDDQNSWRLNRKCTKPAQAFVQNMNNEFQPDIVVDLGDFIDGRDQEPVQTYLELEKIFNQLQAPTFYVLGNHEVDTFPKEKWLQLTGYQNTYYYLDIKQHRLIFLDGNFIPKTHQNAARSADPEHKFYPGYINQEQFVWLKKLLENSWNHQVIVFLHQPPLDSTQVKIREQLLYNGEKIRRLFDQYQVKAVFSGHIEEFCVSQQNQTQYYTLQGFYKAQKKLSPAEQFEDAGVFYQISIVDNDVQVKVFFKKPDQEQYQSFILNQETATCVN